jgi:hypothetical protein
MARTTSLRGRCRSERGYYAYTWDISSAMQGFRPIIFYNSDLNSRTITSDISSYKPKKERKQKNSCATENDDISETSISRVEVYGNRFPSRHLGSTSTTYPYALIKALQRIPRLGDCSQNSQWRAKSYQINYCPLLPGIDLNILVTHLAERTKFHKFNTGNGRHHSQGPHKE